MSVEEIELANKSEVDEKLDEDERPEAGSHINEDTNNNFNVVSTPDHSSKHEDGGSDEISVDGLSGDLADAQDPKNHGNEAHDADFAEDGDEQPPEDHGLAGDEHTQSTLADLNSLVEDATLDDNADERPPEDHDHDGDSLSPDTVSVASEMNIPSVSTRSDIGDGDTGMIFVEDETRVVHRFETA